MRVLLWVLGVPVALVLLAIVAVPMFIDEKALVAIAAEQLEAQNGVILRVDGETSLSLFPKVALSTTDVSVDIPDAQTRITARSVSAGVALLPLLGRSIEVDSISVDTVTLRSVAADEEAAKVAALDTSTLSNAELDAFYVARDAAREQAQAQARGAVGALALPLSLEVGELALSDIRVITVDSNDVPISELQLRFLRATGLNIDGRPVPLSAEVFVPGEGGANDIVVTLDASFSTDLEGDTLTLDELAVEITGATADALTLEASGTVALNTQIADLQLALKTGDLTGSGTVRYASFDSPQIDATLAMTELNPALLVLAGPDAAAATEVTATSTEGDTALPLHALRMVDTRAELSIESVVLDAHRLENVAASLRIVDGVATLKPVTATVHDGAIDFEVVFDARYNTATLLTRGGVNDLNVASAVAAVDAGVSARGVANLDWELQGSGASADELTQSLRGPISFQTDDVVLEGFAMEQMFCKGVALVNQEPLTAEFPSDTAFEALSADIQLADGVARLDPLTAKLPAIAFNGNGSIDLASSDLRASFRAQLGAELGELDPACTINERYADLRWPVECKGNLADDPASWCGVNSTEIIKDLAEGEAKRKVQKEAGRLLKKLFN